MKNVNTDNVQADSIWYYTDAYWGQHLHGHSLVWRVKI